MPPPLRAYEKSTFRSAENQITAVTRFRSSVEQIDGLIDVVHSEVARQRRIALSNGAVHLPRHPPIRIMPSRRAAQFRDVKGFRKIHLEQRALPVRQRAQVVG